MKQERKLQRIDIKGGVLSPVELQRIIEYAQSLNLENFYFGSRQDIIFPINDKDGQLITENAAFDPSFFTCAEQQNICSSYVSIDIFNATVWLRGTTYLYILEDFQYTPKLKVNITDPKQQLVPLFSGDINFIASPNEDYWYLFLKLPGWEEIYYPALIYTWDIAKIAEAIENNYESVNDVGELFQFLNENLDTNNRVIEKTLSIPFNPFPYYEGMNKMGINQYWLGLYWRNNRYDLKFLKALCEFSVEHRIGKICLTPWKSFVIKGIPNESKLPLEKLLGQYGINIRHSALELNWHLPVDNLDALSLKKFLVTNFDQNDISTYGLTFGVSDIQDRKSYFTSIVIERNAVSESVKDFNVLPTYNVLHAKNFNPNTRQYMVYTQDVDQKDLNGILLELTKTYFQKLGEEEEPSPSLTQKKEIIEIEVYQCKHCKTVYDPSIGDPVSQIPAGVDFNELSDEYACPLCEASKSDFEKIVMEVV